MKKTLFCVLLLVFAAAGCQSSAPPKAAVWPGGETSIVAQEYKPGTKIVEADDACDMYSAVSRGDIVHVRAFLKNGVNVNIQLGDLHLTPLMIAAQKGYTDIVRLLLEHKAEVNAKEFDGRTALIAAALYGHTEIVKLLLEHKADVNARDETLNYTPLKAAQRNNHTDIINLLKEYGAKE